jgi:hypothetical protein
MRIQKKRVRNLQVNLPGINVGEELNIVVPIKEIEKSHLQRIGFHERPKTGQRILPSVIGSVSRLNAKGSFIRHRDQPMETCYRQHQWHYTQFHGPDKVDVEEIVDVPYKRYPRTLIDPPSIELEIIVLENGNQAVSIVGLVAFYEDNFANLQHAINLMLELFGFCDVVDKSFVSLGLSPVISLNWKVLPPGEMPWKDLEPHLKKVINFQKKGSRPVLSYRFNIINQYNPKFVAVGHGGFTGYVIFGFPDICCYLLECNRYGNATYVFEDNWGILSQLTKAEILNNNFHKTRIIHLPHWDALIRKLLEEKRQS